MNKLIDQCGELAGGNALLGAGSQLSGAEVLRRLIAKGQYAPGDRLPSERQLIEALGLRRNALRKALDELEFEGVIWRHVGKGTFVSAPSDANGARIADDIGRKMTPIRMVQARLCIEPALAKEAAIHASSGAIERMRQAIFASREATTWPEYEKQDVFFIAPWRKHLIIYCYYSYLINSTKFARWLLATRWCVTRPARQKHTRVLWSTTISWRRLNVATRKALMMK